MSERYTVTLVYCTYCGGDGYTSEKSDVGQWWDEYPCAMCGGDGVQADAADEYLPIRATA